MQFWMYIICIQLLCICLNKNIFILNIRNNDWTDVNIKQCTTMPHEGILSLATKVLNDKFTLKKIYLGKINPYINRIFRY